MERTATERIYNDLMRIIATTGKRPSAIYISYPLYRTIGFEMDAIWLNLQDTGSVLASFCGIPVKTYPSQKLEYSFAMEVHEIE